MNRTLRLTAVVVAAAAAGAAVATLLVRDQITRHRRNLFSPMAFRRLAALQHMAGADPSVDNITVLRDFIAWEPRPLLRNRAQGIVRRMEAEALGASELLPG